MACVPRLAEAAGVGVVVCRTPTEAALLVLSSVPQRGSNLPDFFLSIICQHFKNQSSTP